MSPQPTPPNPLTERLRQKIAGKQGWDTLCLPVGEIRLIADDLDRSSRLRGQLWPSLGRPEGGGLDVELIDAVADLADHRDQLRVEREAHEASLARVTAERDEARAQHAAVLAQRDSWWETMGAQKQALRDENAQLRAHILDIDAHATPDGELPDEPGYVGTYLLTAGALHRALGTIGHTSPSCTAEAELNQLREQRAAVLAYLDDCDYSLTPVDADEIRNRLGATS